MRLALWIFQHNKSNSSHSQLAQTTLYSSLPMSLTFFTEPFYSLADFDSLFDEAFNARTSGSATVAHRDRASEGRHLHNAASRPMRPR